jgi:hypothetical protein
MPLGSFRLNGLAKYEAPSGPAPVTLDAISFENNEFLRVASMPAAASANKQLTVSVWTKVYNTTPRSAAMGFYKNGRLIAGPFQYQGGATTFRTYTQTNSQTYDTTSSQSSLYTTGTWNHFVWSLDFTVNNKVQGYCNGVPVTFAAFNASTFTTNIEWNVSGEFEINGYSNGTNLNKIDVAQVWITNSYIDLSTNISKFYNNGPVDMGSNGTASGLSQPLIYHNGNLSTFVNNGGTLSYSLSATGTPESITGPST